MLRSAGVLDRALVVPVDRADVLQAEVLEQPLRRDDVLEALLQPVQRVVGQPARRTGAPQRGPAPRQHGLVAAVGAQRVQVLRQPADGRGVRATVVVDDDHHPAVLPPGDVVQRFPGHPAGQGAVADHRDDAAVGLALQLARLCDAVRPAERGGRVRVLDDVVLGLGAARVPGQAAASPQLREVRPPGEQLVHVRLVPGVEDDGVPRGGEHAVQRDRQLDDTQVGSEVPAGAGHRLDEERADLVGQLVDLARGEPAHVLGRADGVEKTHRTSSHVGRAASPHDRASGAHAPDRPL